MTTEIPEGQMTTAQAAEFLGVSASYVQIFIKKGVLKQTGNAPGKGASKLVSIVEVKKLKADRDEGKPPPVSPKPKNRRAGAAPATSAATTGQPPARAAGAATTPVLRWILDGAACGALTADEALARIRAELDK